MSNTTIMNPICMGSCNDRGVCIAGQVCLCYQGFFGNTCEQTMYDIYPIIWPALQYIFAIGYVIMFALSAWILYALYRRKRNTSSESLSSNRTALWVMLIYTTYELSCIIIFFVDPLGTIYFPYWVISVWSAYRVCFGVVILGLILFHWIEVFNTALITINRNNQLNKIALHVKDKHITIEEVLAITERVFKMKVPYIICVGIISLFQIPVVITQIQYSVLSLTLGVVNLVLLASFYLFFEIGFLIYGKKISDIIPRQHTTRFRSLNRKVQIYCIVGITILVTFVLWGFFWTTPLGLLFYYLIATVNQWILTPMIFTNYASINLKKLKTIITEYTEDSTSRTSGTEDSPNLPMQDNDEVISIYS